VAAASARGASVHVAFFEVYRGQVLDLLGRRARVQQRARRARSACGAAPCPWPFSLGWTRRAHRCATQRGTSSCCRPGPICGCGMAAGPGNVADSAASTTTQVEPLEDAQGCVHLVGLTELEVGGAAELLDLVRKAEQRRATGATSVRVRARVRVWAWARVRVRVRVRVRLRVRVRVRDRVRTRVTLSLTLAADHRRHLGQ
jgi:hypothetical protein